MTTDRVRILTTEEQEMKRELDKVDWSCFFTSGHGNVEISVQNYKPKIMHRKDTTKLD